MINTLARLLKSRLMLVILGAVLVTGGGTAVAVAAHNATAASSAAAIATQQASCLAPTADDQQHDEQDAEASTRTIEGTLTAYDATAHTISVKREGPSCTTVVTVTDKTTVQGEQATHVSDLSNVIGQHVQVRVQKQTDGTLVARSVMVSNTHDKNERAGTGSSD